MLRGDRLNIIAVGLAGLLALGAGFHLYRSAAASHAEYQKTADEQAQNYADRRDRDLEGCAQRVQSEQASCRIDAEERAREGERKERDLEAQRITAVWTQHMGIAAMIGMAVSIVGVGLVWTTFRESKRSADAAQDNYLAFIRFEAAVMNVTTCNATLFYTSNSQKMVRFGLAVENVGRSPALIESVFLEGQRETAYHAIIASAGRCELAAPFRVQEWGDRVLKGMVQYSTGPMSGVRRIFGLSIEQNLDGARIVRAFPLWVLYPGDEYYDDPFAD